MKRIRINRDLGVMKVHWSVWYQRPSLVTDSHWRGHPECCLGKQLIPEQCNCVPIPNAQWPNRPPQPTHQAEAKTSSTKQKPTIGLHSQNWRPFCLLPHVLPRKKFQAIFVFSLQSSFLIHTVVGGVICIIGLLGNTASLYVLSKVRWSYCALFPLVFSLSIQEHIHCIPNSVDEIWYIHLHKGEFCFESVLIHCSSQSFSSVKLVQFRILSHAVKRHAEFVGKITWWLVERQSGQEMTQPKRTRLLYVCRHMVENTMVRVAKPRRILASPPLSDVAILSSWNTHLRFLQDKQKPDPYPHESLRDWLLCGRDTPAMIPESGDNLLSLAVTFFRGSKIFVGPFNLTTGSHTNGVDALRSHPANLWDAAGFHLKHFCFTMFSCTKELENAPNCTSTSSHQTVRFCGKNLQNTELYPNKNLFQPEECNEKKKVWGQRDSQPRENIRNETKHESFVHVGDTEMLVWRSWPSVMLSSCLDWQFL